MSKRLNSHLSKKQINEIKERLHSESERIRNKFETKKREFTERDTSKDEVDSANDNILLSHDMRFSNRDIMYLKKINKALIRAEDEEFGMCQDCGDAISYQRLVARPTSELCIVCKEESERDENQNFFQRKSKSLGKEVNLVRSI